MRPISSRASSSLANSFAKLELSNSSRIRHETGNFAGGDLGVSSKKQTTGNNSSAADPRSEAFNMTLASESIGVLGDSKNKKAANSSKNLAS